MFLDLRRNVYGARTNSKKEFFLKTSTAVFSKKCVQIYTNIGAKSERNLLLSHQSPSLHQSTTKTREFVNVYGTKFVQNVGTGLAN